MILRRGGCRNMSCRNVDRRCELGVKKLLSSVTEASKSRNSRQVSFDCNRYNDCYAIRTNGELAMLNMTPTSHQPRGGLEIIFRHIHAQLRSPSRFCPLPILDFESYIPMILVVVTAILATLVSTLSLNLSVLDTKSNIP